MDREKISGSWFFFDIFETFHISVPKMILGQKIFFWATGRRWKLKIFLNFDDSLWRHNTFMKYSFLSDINFIWRSFRNTHNFSKWTTQFVWISSKVSYFSYFKRISRDPNSENGRFWQKIFWRIFSVTDIYQIAKNKDFLRPAPFETAWFLQKVSLKQMFFQYVWALNINGIHQLYNLFIYRYSVIEHLFI